MLAKIVKLLSNQILDTVLTSFPCVADTVHVMTNKQVQHQPRLQLGLHFCYLHHRWLGSSSLLVLVLSSEQLSPE